MTELDIYQPAAIDGYQARMVMTPEAAKALDDQVRACTVAVLREGTDYGVIPGTSGEQVLFKPGAEKLLQWFGYAFTMTRLDIDLDDDGRKQGVTYRCTVVRRLGGGTAEVAASEGYAGYDEDKFFQTAEAAQFKAEAKERMWAERDRRVANPNKWKYLTGYRAPWNTIIKMAQKRALVGATIVATAAGGLFGTEEDASPAADDGSTWHEQALAAAGTFTDEADEGRLYVEAARAARDGLCSPQQATHIQNLVRQRGRQLKNVTVTDVEDLGRTEDPAPAAADAEPAAGAVPGDERHRRLVGAVQGEFKRLGFTDDDRGDRLWAAAKLAASGGIASLNDLDPEELTAVRRKLARCKDRAALEEMLPAAGEGGGSE